MKEDIFKALADESRRLLLDILLERDGQTLSELTKHLSMTRYGVMKHLNILEQTGLLTTKKVGREKYHYLNPVPIRQIYNRWVSKYSEPWVASLSQLKTNLEGEINMSQKPDHVFQILIRTTPKQLWQAITDPDQTMHYIFKSRIHSDWKAGSTYEFINEEGEKTIQGKLLEIDPPKRLVMTWEMLSYEETASENPSTVTWEITSKLDMPDICILTVTHDRLDNSPNTYKTVSKGWPVVLSGLKTLLETGKPLIM